MRMWIQATMFAGTNMMHWVVNQLYLLHSKYCLLTRLCAHLPYHGAFVSGHLNDFPQVSTLHHPLLVTFNRRTFSCIQYNVQRNYQAFSKKAGGAQWRRRTQHNLGTLDEGFQHFIGWNCGCGIEEWGRVGHITRELFASVQLSPRFTGLGIILNSVYFYFEEQVYSATQWHSRTQRIHDHMEIMYRVEIHTFSSWISVIRLDFCE